MPTYYHVAPRYTAGSPAQVDAATAERVAKDEVHFQQRDMEGYFGEARREHAKTQGLTGIAYRTMEKGAFVYVDDLITEERFKVPLKWWGVAGPNRKRVSWYERKDREQFRVEGGTTAYEARGNVYEYTRPCPVCKLLPGSGRECRYCDGEGVEKVLLKKGL